MSGQAIPTSIRILDKEYAVSCPEGEQEALRASAAYLDERMRETRDAGNVIGTERIAVMTALNVVAEFLKAEGERERTEIDLAARIDKLREKVGHTLEGVRPVHGRRSGGG